MDIQINVTVDARSIARKARRLALVCGALLVGTAHADQTVFESGDVLTAEALNGNFTELYGDVADLEARLDMLEHKVHEPSAFRAIRTNSLAVASANATTIAFNSEQFDLGGEYDPTTGVFSPTTAGTYLLTCSIWGQTPGAGVVWSIGLLKNGTQLLAKDEQTGAGPGKGLNATIEAVVSLAAGDDIQCSIWQDSANNQTFNNAFQERPAFAAARLY